MTEPNSDILTALRSLLLLWPEVTGIVDDRIRPNVFHSTDGNDAALRLELVDGNQTNFLDRSGACVDGVLQITARDPLATGAAELAEYVRSRGTNPSTGLDGYSGSAGSGNLLSAERVGFTTGREVDDDGNETGNFLFVQVFQILFAIGG